MCGTIIQRLEEDCNILQRKMSKALNDDSTGTYINLQKALVNNVNAIRELKKTNPSLLESVNEKAEFFYKEWEKRFLWEQGLGLPRTVFDVTSMTRNIGKTTFLINQAKINDGVFISPLGYNSVRNNGVKTISKKDDLIGLEKNKKIYVDEMVSDDIVEYVKENFSEYFIFKVIK